MKRRKFWPSIFLMTVVTAAYVSAASLRHNAEIDLNGDNKIDAVKLKSLGSGSDYILFINNSIVKGTFENLDETTDGFILIDIDKRDRYREVAVHNPGPSDDDEYDIYWYDGKRIKKIGTYGRWPEFPGNGTMVLGKFMGFWTKKELYTFDNKKKKFNLVKKSLYPVNVNIIVKEPFFIYSARSIRSKAHRLFAGEKINLVECDTSGAKENRMWYRLKSETGKTGWAIIGSFQDKVKGIVWAD
jgi:hypothetical protein